MLVATRHWLATSKAVKVRPSFAKRFALNVQLVQSNSAAADGQGEALASLQESAIVQMLLEICDPLGVAHSADASEGPLLNAL